MRGVRGFISMGFAVASGLWTPSAHACATCFGQSDSPLAQAMNWGILTLLIFIGSMLLSIASFFFFLARRAARTAHVTA